MTMTLNQRRRMAHVRYLHQLGIDQAKLPDPQASVSVLLLHDAVESFLALAGDHVGVAPREFEKYWPEIKKNLPGEAGLPMQAGMFRLNKVRVALKHYGAQPNMDTVEQLVADTATFLAASVQLVFDVDYSSISMVDLISQDLTRRLAKEAEVADSSGDLVTAMMRLREASDCLFADHQPQYHRTVRSSPFAFGPNLDGPPSHSLFELGLEKEIEPIKDTLRSMQTAMRLAVLAVDFAAYLRFDMLVPKAHRRPGSPTVNWSVPRGYAPDQEAFDFCMQFLVTASLRLDAAEARAADPVWMTRDHYGRVEMEHFREELAIENRLKPSDEH